MVKKSTFRKPLSKEYASCWFCSEPTQFTCIKKDGSEFFCCINCLWNEEKIQNFNPKTRKYSTFQKKCKKALISCVNKSKKAVSI